MNAERNKYNEDERIMATILDANGVLLTGSTSVTLTIQREIDDYYFDFDDSTFKNAGWTSSGQPMTELDATGMAGTYYYDWDTANIGTQGSQRNYLFRAYHATASNSPQEGELKLGGWIDSVGLAGGYTIAAPNGITLKELKKEIEKVWQVKLKNDETAEDILLSRSTFNAAQDIVKTEPDKKLEKALNALQSDLSDFNENMVSEASETRKTLLEALQGLKSYDYSKILSNLEEKVAKIDKHTIQFINSADKLGFKNNELVKELSTQIETITESLKILNDYLDEKQKAHDLMCEEMDKEMSEEMKVKMEEMMTCMEDCKKDMKEGIGKLAMEIMNSKFSQLEEFAEDMEIMKKMMSLLNEKLNIQGE